MKGKVKWFNEKKGYGFITGTDGIEYFVHFSSIAGDGFRTLKEGADVTYDPSENEKGMTAINVQRA